VRLQRDYSKCPLTVRVVVVEIGEEKKTDQHDTEFHCKSAAIRRFFLSGYTDAFEGVVLLRHHLEKWVENVM
jgi:hypothetical protein